MLSKLMTLVFLAIAADSAGNDSLPGLPGDGTPQSVHGPEIPKAETQPADAPQWTLRYQFQPDQKLRYQTHQIMTLESQLAENVKRDVSELKQRRVFTVLSREESGAAEIAMQFEQIWMKMQTDDREPVEFDSTMKAEEVPPAFRNTFHQLKGSAPKYWLSDRGLSLFEEKKSLRAGAAAISQVAYSQVAAATETAVRLAAHAQDPSVATGKSREIDAGTFLMPLPEKSVGIGSTWKESITVPVRLTEEINRQVTILRTYRLDSVDKGIATISFRSSIESPVKGVAVRTQLIQATPQGTLQFDLERGLMLRREMRFNESVLGVFGNESVLSSVGTNTEELIEPVTATAAK